MAFDRTTRRVYSLGMNAIDKANDLSGGLSALAKKLGVSPQVISNWRSRGVPAERCIDIEKVTGGAVTCEELRPDLSDRWAYLRGTEKKIA